MKKRSQAAIHAAKDRVKRVAINLARIQKMKTGMKNERMEKDIKNLMEQLCNTQTELDMLDNATERATNTNQSR